MLYRLNCTVNNAPSSLTVLVHENAKLQLDLSLGRVENLKRTLDEQKAIIAHAKQISTHSLLFLEHIVNWSYQKYLSIKQREIRDLEQNHERIWTNIYRVAVDKFQRAFALAQQGVTAETIERNTSIRLTPLQYEALRTDRIVLLPFNS